MPLRVARVSVVALGLTMALQLSVLAAPFEPSGPDTPELPEQLPPEAFEAVVALPATVEEKFRSSDERARSDAALELVAAIEAEWPDDHRRSFLVDLAPHALQSAVDHCVPPSVTLAQAVLESGWGRSGLARNHNNLFGVKDFRGGVALTTTEHEDGEISRKQQRFKRYDGIGDSIEHHGRLLSGDDRYAAAMANWEHWPLFLKTMAPVYATDPKYVRRVSQLVHTYHLDRFDYLVILSARKHGDCPGL